MKTKKKRKNFYQMKKRKLDIEIIEIKACTSSVKRKGLQKGTIIIRELDIYS